jgi:hypothetical protein
MVNSEGQRLFMNCRTTWIKKGDKVGGRNTLRGVRNQGRRHGNVEMACSSAFSGVACVAGEAHSPEDPWPTIDWHVQHQKQEEMLTSRYHLDFFCIPNMFVVFFHRFDRGERAVQYW